MNTAVRRREAVAVRLGTWSQMREQASRIRFEVFVCEQRVPIEVEIDEFDPVSVHAIAESSAGRAVGTGRLLPDGHIGRMAVRSDSRADGVGTALLTALMHEARRLGHRQVELSAQTHACGFYRKFGFVEVGQEYLDAGIAHVTMRASLTPIDSPPRR